MKQPKRLTREMKILLMKNGYDPSSYKYIKNTKDTVIFVNIETGKRLVIERKWFYGHYDFNKPTLYKYDYDWI